MKNTAAPRSNDASSRRSGSVPGGSDSSVDVNWNPEASRPSERDLTGDEDPAAAGLGTRASAPRGRGAERRGRTLTGRTKCRDEPESQSRQERGHECARHDRPVQRHERRNAATARSPPRREGRAAPMARTRLSMISCRTSRSRDAPSARRTATSRLRPEARTRRRFAALTQAIARTRRGMGRTTAITSTSSMSRRAGHLALTRSTESSTDATSRPAPGSPAGRATPSRPATTPSSVSTRSTPTPSPHSADVSNQAIAGPLKRIVPRNTIHETDRQPEVDAPHVLSLSRACESPRCDADDLESLPSRLDGLSDYGRSPAEFPHPQRMTDDRHRRFSPGFLRRKVRPISAGLRARRNSSARRRRPGGNAVEAGSPPRRIR